MAEAASSPKGGKLDNLPKEDLIKYIRKQAVQIKDVKKKNEDLTTLFNHEKQEVERLEQEKKSWLARGVSAEFEKKEKLAKKDRELRIAAQLGQKMLVENDELRIKFDEQELEHEKAVKETEDRLSQVMKEKLMLEETVKAVQAEYKLAKEEAESFSKALERALADQERESESNKKKIAHLTAELKDVQHALDLERKGKGETDFLVKEVKNLRAENDDLMTMNLELKAKVNSFPNTDAQEMLRMKEELKDMETVLKSNQKETEATRKSFGALKAELEESRRNCAELHQHIELIHADKEECNNYAKQLDEELLKLKSDKEKAMKSIKVLKTKAERGSQVEEELRRQLCTICAERDDIQSKHTVLQREKKTLMLNVKKLKEKLRNVQKDQKEEEDSERGRDSPRGSENDVSIEYLNLKEYSEKLEQEKKELYEQYEAVKAEIANIEGERSEMEHMIRSYETEILKLNDKFEMLRREHDAIKFENDENVSSKAALEEEKEHLLAGKQALEQDIEKIMEEKDGILSRYSALEEELNNYKALNELREGEKIGGAGEGVTGEEIDLVKSEVLRLEQSLEVVKEQNTKSETVISELQETVKEKEEDVKRLTDEKQNLENQCCLLTQRLDETGKAAQDDLTGASGEGETEGDKGEPDRSEEGKEKLLQELARAKEHCRQLELKLDCLREKEQIAEQLKLEKETLESKCKDILSRMESLEFERAEISTNAQEDFARLSEEKEVLLCTLEKEREEQSHLEQLCEDLRRQNELLSGKQQEHKANVTRLQGRVDELLGKLQALNEEKMHQESEIEELFKAQDELQNKLDVETREKKDKEFIIKDLEEKLSAMEEDLNRTSQEKQDTFSRLQDLLKTQESYQGELQSRINEMRLENETLREENQALKEAIVTYKEEIKVHNTQVNESRERQEEITEEKKKEAEGEEVCISNGEPDKVPAMLNEQAEESPEKHKLERDDELTQLQKEMKILTSERDDLQGLLDEKESFCQVLQGRLAEIESSGDESNETDERLHNLMQLSHEQALRLKQNDCVIQELQEANTELDSMLRTATRELEVAEERVKELGEVKEKLIALDSELISLVEEKDLLKRSLDSAVAEKGEKAGEVERLRDALTRAEEAFHERHFEATQTSSGNHAARDEESTTLSQKASDLEYQVEILQQKNENLMRGKLTVGDWFSCDQDSVQDIEAEKQTLKERVFSLEEEVEKKDASLIQLQQDVASLMKELDNCREEIQKFKEQQDLMQAEFTAKGEELSKSQKALAKLKQVLQKQKELNQSLKESERKANEMFSEEKQNLMNTISEKEVLIEEFKAIELNLVQEIEERKNIEVEKSETLQQVADQEMILRQSVLEKEAEVVEYQKTVERLKEDREADVSRLEASLYEKNLQCQSLASEKENLVNQCKQLSHDLEEAIRFASAAEEEKHVVEASLKDRIALVSDLCIEKEKLLQDVACKDEELAGMRHQHSPKVGHENNTQEVLLKAARDAKDKDDYIDELQEEIRQLKTQCDHWRGKMEASRNERSVVEEKMQKCENEANWHAGKVSEVQSALEEASRKLEAKDEEARAAQLRMGELEDELQEAFNKLEELESLMKEKEEKVNKFKAVAMRAKKELDHLRSQSDPEKERLQSANEQLQKIAQQFEAELLRQREDCQRHEEDYEAVQKEATIAKTSLEEESRKLREKEEEIQSLNDQVERLTTSLAASENETTILQERLTEETQRAESLKGSLSEMTKRFEEYNSRCQEEQESSKALKERLKVMEVQINDAQKEFQHMNVINLEIQDYQKTIESLQKRVAEREERIKDCEKQISVLEGTMVTLREQLSSTEQQLQESDERSNKLKSVLVKTKKDLNDAKQTETEMQKSEKSLRRDIEATTQLLEDYKLQTTDLLSEKESLLAQLKSNAEMSQRSHQALEMKLSRVQNELVASQQLHAQLKQEFENYKIRAATVLKQQRIKTPEEDKSLDKREREMYEQAIEQLKNKIKESNDHVQVLMHDHEELELEHERLLQRHSEVLKEVQGVDQKWKSRFENAQKDSNERIMDYEEKLKELTAQKESITGLYKKQRENFEKGEQDRENQLSLLKQELEELRRQSRRKSDASEKKEVADPKSRSKELKLKSPERLKLTIDTGSSRPPERQEGEGMDSSLLEAMEPNTRLTPTSPASSFESANLLERLLSPTDKSPESEWIYSPVQSVEEGIKLKSSHATLEKRVEHLTELLHESEANSVRLTDQAKILKDEIRRLEKNQEREEAMHNLEYLKNVTIKFLKCGAAEREYLVPVLSTMLKLNSEEIDFIKEFAKSEQEISDANASSWSSYVYRWSAF